MAYLYRHIRLDKNEPFYIGIGSDDKYIRANDFKSNRRNIMWNRIISKTEIICEIILDDLTWEEACEKEKEFIALYGRKDKNTGILCNLTDGGDGAFGHIVSEETKLILSKKFKGVNNPFYNKTHSKETLEKLSNSLKNREVWNKGKTGIYSKETLQKMSESSKGKKAWNKGLKNVNGKGLSKIVLDLSTGIFYDSCKKAAEAHNIPHSTLKNRLNGYVKNNTNLIYV
jgi:hypothetical protein